MSLWGSGHLQWDVGVGSIISHSACACHAFLIKQSGDSKCPDPTGFFIVCEWARPLGGPVETRARSRHLLRPEFAAHFPAASQSPQAWIYITCKCQFGENAWFTWNVNAAKGRGVVAIALSGVSPLFTSMCTKHTVHFSEVFVVVFGFWLWKRLMHCVQ